MSSVEMFYSETCPYCKRAKVLLENKGAVIQIFDVDQDASNWEISKIRSGRDTVPQIFIHGRHVGGCDDLFKLENDGLLDAWLSNNAM